MYDGDCTIMKCDTTGKVSGKEDDVAVFMLIEGGFLCATVFWVRLGARLQEKCRTQQIKKIYLKEQKKINRLFFGFKLVLYIINVGLCIAGMLPYSLFISFVVKKGNFFFGWNHFFVYFGITYERIKLSSKAQDDVRLVVSLSNLIAINFDVIREKYLKHTKIY